MRSIVCSVFVGSVICIGTVGAGTEQRPNIVLVMADDQGWGDMAYNGHPTLKTPHFDAAAASGLRFDRFYAAAPVCSPTRGSVMTGRHPNRYGVFKWGYPLRPQETTIAEALKSAGYHTGHFGKWHLGSVRRQSPTHPGAHGFDEWFSAPNFFDNDPILSRRGTATRTMGESSMVTVEAAIEWMKTKVTKTATKGARPFLAVVWFGSPHGPHRAADVNRQPYVEQPRNLQNFYGEITGMDRAFGRLRASLQELGIRENTIFWYCSDNGALPRVGSTGGRRGNKGQIYEGGLLVPAILEWPARLQSPRVTNVRCSTCDIYPTLRELAGLPPQDRPVLDGISLVPLITDDMQHQPSPMGFWDYPARGISTPSAKWMADLWSAQQNGRDLEPDASSRHPEKLPEPPYAEDEFPGHAAWIDGRWKLHRIESRNGDVTWELYDLSRDPMEKVNLVDKEERHVRALDQKLQAWMQSVTQSLNGNDYQPPARRVSD